MGLQEQLEQCRIVKKIIESKEQELVDQIHEAEQKLVVPLVRVATSRWGSSRNRLILNLTPAFFRLIEQNKGRVVAFGDCGAHGVSIQCHSIEGELSTVDTLVEQYSNVETLMGLGGE